MNWPNFRIFVYGKRLYTNMKFEVGDRVRCIIGPSSRQLWCKGAGWEHNRVFTIGLVHQWGHSACYFDSYIGDGVYEEFLERISFKPKKNIKKHSFGNIGRRNELVTQ